MKMRRLGLWFFIMAVLGSALAATNLPFHAVMIIGGTAGFVGGAYLSHKGLI